MLELSRAMRGRIMWLRIGAALLAAAMLSACGTLHCAENSQNSQVNGGCGLQHTF
jgi:hypothetical protein